MDSIEKLLKTGRPAKPPEHNFQIIFEGSEPKLPVTDYRELEKFGGKCVKLGNGGTTFDPCTEFTKLPDDEKDKLTAEAIKIIEKREEERKLE
jgi:hypothetical protein